MTRRVLLAGAPAILRGAAQRRPNVLWLMTDEHRPDSLRCYGGKWAHSPNMDALAARGALFESAYVPSPVCVPCRSSLLTGQMPSETGVLHNQGRLRPGTQMLTWRFEDAGYATASFGKKHYFLPGERQAFQTEAGTPTEGIVDPERYGPSYKPAEHDAVFYSPSATQKAQRQWVLAGRFPASEDETAEARNVALATKWLGARDAQKPFFLRLSLNAPHTPVVVPAQYLKLIDPDRIQVPQPTETELQSQPARVRQHLRGFQGSQVLKAEELRKARYYYYARAAFADAMMGRLLGWLEKQGLLENTVVVMTADHGTHLGDHGLLQKQTFYEQVATVPYIFAGPGIRRAKFRTPVSTVHLLPTLMALCGLESRAGLGQALQQGKEPPARPVFSEIAYGYQGYRDADRQVMVRDGDWKLSLFTDGEPDGALYDLRRDPQEATNLFGRGLAPERQLRRLMQP